MYYRYRQLSSNDLNHLTIDDIASQSLCNVMNKLQSQPFKINSDLLETIQQNEDQLVKMGLLYPRFLSNLNIIKVTNKLRDAYMKNDAIKNSYYVALTNCSIRYVKIYKIPDMRNFFLILQVLTMVYCFICQPFWTSEVESTAVVSCISTSVI